MAAICHALIRPPAWGLLLAVAHPVFAIGEVKSIENFDEAGLRGPNPEAISHWKWSEEEKRSARDFSRIRIGEGEGTNSRALAVSILKPLPRAADFYSLWTTALDYLPPDAVSVRMRARVAAGAFTLTVGSATAYYANSDVWARPQVLKPGGWQTLEFSLVSDLQRNFRRAIFSAESPVIHYTRWIQEPMRVMISADSHGELWLDDIELVASGQGDTAGRGDEVADALAAADLRQAFTFATDDKEFDLARTPGMEALRKPAILTLPDAIGGPLEARQRGLEEMSFIGIPISCPAGANAFRVRLKAAHPGRLEHLVVDFLALVSPDGSAPWGGTIKGGAGGFDFCLSPLRMNGQSWGFYHARGAVPNGESATLVIPFGDFVCAYGSGGLRQRHQQQQPLLAGEVVALALVSPFRQASAETAFTIHSIEAVRLKN